MACSIDIKDLYYSLPHDKLMASVEECIDRHGYVAFQNEAGVSVSKFLELLAFYLKSTFATWNDKVFIQKNGVCIGSCIAPVLSDIYLSFYNRVLSKKLEGSNFARIFKFVDDYLVLFECDKKAFGDEVSSVLTTFSDSLKPLILTHEVLVNSFIRFLDLRLHFCDAPTCWAYEPRSNKPLLPF